MLIIKYLFYDRAATESDNYFHNYTKNAPLIVIVFPQENVKIQLHVYNDSIQFNNEQDSSVDRKFVLDHWENLKGLVEWAYEQNPEAIKFLPKEFISYNEFFTAANRMNRGNTQYLRHDVSSLLSKFVSTELDPKIYRDAIEMDWGVTRWIAKSAITLELAHFAISKSGLSLALIPDEIKDYDLCRKAVENSGRSLRNVPEQFKNQEICLSAIENSGTAIEFFPTQFKTVENYQHAFEQDEWVLTLMPKNLKTIDMVKNAVSRDGAILKYVKGDFLTEEVCKLAFDNNPESFEWYPEFFKTESVCNRAVELIAQNIRFVPDQYQTLELQKKSYFLDPSVGKYLSKDHIQEIKSAYLKANPKPAELDAPLSNNIEENTDEHISKNALKWDLALLDNLQERLNNSLMINQENMLKI